jgi:hypothetical protein
MGLRKGRREYGLGSDSILIFDVSDKDYLQKDLMTPRAAKCFKQPVIAVNFESCLSGGRQSDTHPSH